MPAEGLLAALGGEEAGPGLENEGDQGLSFEAKEMAAEDLASALASKDYKAAAEAFQRMYDACSREDLSEEDF